MTSIEPMTIIETMAHKRVFGPMFRRRWWAGDSWAPWKSFLRSLFALQPGKDDMAIYKACTGRTEWPARAAKEAWLAAGRRGGKSRISALLATYLAAFKRYEGLLAPGEVATIACISADRKQSRTVLEYVRGFIMGCPMLKEMVVAEGADSIELSNRVRIEIHRRASGPRGVTLWRPSSATRSPTGEAKTAARP